MALISCQLGYHSIHMASQRTSGRPSYFISLLFFFTHSVLCMAQLTNLSWLCGHNGFFQGLCVSRSPFHTLLPALGDLRPNPNSYSSSYLGFSPFIRGLTSHSPIPPENSSEPVWRSSKTSQETSYLVLLALRLCVGCGTWQSPWWA